MPARFKDLCLDASDHQALADWWWCPALGYVRQVGERPRPPAWPVPIEDPVGHGPLTWITLAGRIQADRDGLDLFTVADPRTAVTSWTRTR